MPRKASDKTVTHRIELGLVERDKLNQIINTQKENQRLDALTATLQAAGMAIGGIGALGAGLALAAWLAPGIIDSVKNKTKDAVDDLTKKGISILNDVLPENARITEVEELRNEYDSLQASLRAAGARKNQFCTPSSIDYNEQTCVIATDEYDNAKKELNDYITRMKEYAEAVKEGGLQEGLEKINPIFKFMPGGDWSIWDD